MLIARIIFTCALLYASGAAKDSLMKNCSKSGTVKQGDFDLDTAHSHETHVPHFDIPWSHLSHPFTFFVKASGKKSYSEVALVVHLEGFHKKGQLVNCYLSSACSDILTCCYEFLLPRPFERRYNKHCPSSASCRRKQQPCEATCFKNMLVNVAFTRNRPNRGGSIYVSVDFEVERLRQSADPFTGEAFTQVHHPETEGKVFRKRLAKAESASPINSEIPVGFWVRYTKEATRLEVGMDGRYEPSINLELWDHILQDKMENETHGDNYGWYGDEVYELNDVFLPSRYSFNIPRGGGEVEVAWNCSNVLYAKWGQVQMSGEGGSCINSKQCPLGYRCAVDEGGPQELKWMERKTCKPVRDSFFDQHWVAIITLTTIAVFIISLVLTYFLYRNNNVRRRGRNYLLPLDSIKKKVRNNTQVKTGTQTEEEDFEAASDDTVIRAPSRKSEKILAIRQFHELDLKRKGEHDRGEGGGGDDKTTDEDDVKAERKRMREKRRKRRRKERERRRKKREKELREHRKKNAKLKDKIIKASKEASKRGE